MIARPALAPLVASLSASVPFVGPEALERADGSRISVRIGANESLFGPSPAVLAAIARAAESIQLYGDPEGWALRGAIAAHHGVALEQIALGTGIDELLGLFVRAYVAPGEVAVMSAGGYPTMAYQLVTHGARIRTVPYREDRNDPMALVREAEASGARLLYLSTPDNPTGTCVSAAAQAEMVGALPPDCLFVLDEAYAEFAPSESCAEIDPADPRVVRLRTFSKAHGLAGMRVGYAYGAPQTVRPLDRIRNQFGVGRMAQAAALAAISDLPHVRSVVAAVAEGREAYAETARSLGLPSLPSATNFVAIDLGTRKRAVRAVELLRLRHGVFVRMPSTPPLDRYIRVTVGRPVEQKAFANALAQIIPSLDE